MALFILEDAFSVRTDNGHGLDTQSVLQYKDGHKTHYRSRRRTFRCSSFKTHFKICFIQTDNASCGRTMRPVALSVRTENVSSSIKTANNLYQETNRRYMHINTSQSEKGSREPHQEKQFIDLEPTAAFLYRLSYEVRREEVVGNKVEIVARQISREHLQIQGDALSTCKCNVLSIFWYLCCVAQHNIALIVDMLACMNITALNSDRAFLFIMSR